MDGVSQTINQVVFAYGNPRVGLRMPSTVPAYARVLVTFDKTANASRPTDSSNNQFGSFTNVEMAVSVVTEDVYDALGAYFSGTETVSGEGMLSLVNRFIRDVYGDDVTYHEKLLEKVDAGQLDDIVPGPQSAWGDPGTEDWAQMGQGFPRCIYDAQGNCIDMSETWGERYKCGNKPQPGLADNDFGDFFWACNDGQWVPVRRPRPGVDYAHDHQLIRPGQPGYDNKCLYVRRHPDGHPQAGQPVLDENGNRIPEPVSRYNGNGTWTTIRGANYDPIDGSCRGRG